MKTYNKFLLFTLLTFFSNLVVACFINGQSCYSNSKMFDITYDANSIIKNNDFTVNCNFSDTYTYTYTVTMDGFDRNIISALSPDKLTNVGGESHKVTFNPVGNGTTKVLFNYLSNRNGYSGSCYGNITVSNLKVTSTTTSTSVPITKSIGTAFHIGSSTSTAVLPIVDFIPDVGFIYLPDNSSLQVDLGTILGDTEKQNLLDINSNTVLTFNPLTDTAVKVVNLLRGSINVEINSQSKAQLKIVTPTASITIGASTQRITTAENSLSVSYSQAGDNGTTAVNVISGSVDVVERNGNTSNVVAGSNINITGFIPRTSWVLPTDGDNIYGGQDNVFIWLASPNAKGYLFEYNFLGNVFANDNSSSVEFTDQAIKIPESWYQVIDDLVILVVPFAEFSETTKKLKVETRLFATDVNQQLLPANVSSDKTTLGFK